MTKPDPGISVRFITDADTAVFQDHKNYSLEINYDASASGAYLWFVDCFSQDGRQDVDTLASFKYLSFWVRGAKGGEGFEIGLGRAHDPDCRIRVNQCLKTGITQQWQKVVIPLNAINVARANISKVAIVINNAELDGLEKGTFYIDNITFGTSTAPIWVSNYDHDSWKTNTDGPIVTALHGNVKALGDGLNLTYDSSACVTSPNSLACAYPNTYSSGCFSHDLNSLDLTGCTAVQFDIIGTVGNDNRKVRLQTTGVASGSVIFGSSITPDFKTVIIPLAEFTDFIKDSSWNVVGELDFDAPDPVTTPGKFNIDNVLFIDTSFPNAPRGMVETPWMSPIEDGHTFIGRSIGLAVTVPATNPPDKKMERVVWEYSVDNTQWIGFDNVYADTDTKTSYETAWDRSGLKDGTYYLRATSFHVGETSASNESRQVALALNATFTPTVVPGHDVQGSAWPNPFLPGRGQTTHIQFAPESGEHFTIKFFTLQGKQVRFLTDSQDWDGRNDSGKVCEGGLYIYQIEGRNRRLHGKVVLIR
jgi:hypothetical protein